VEAASESQWQMAVGSSVSKTQLIQAGNFILSPSYGYSASSLLANEDPAAIAYIRDFSHHNYPQTMATGAPIPSPNLTTLMSHSNISGNVAPYAADTEAAHAKGLEYVFGETNSGEHPVLRPGFVQRR
jgi:hypothetical protein